jgi:hypothetical protein
MANKLSDAEIVTVEEAIVSQSYEIAALVSVLEKKGLLSRDEVIVEIKRLRGAKDTAAVGVQEDA